MSERLFRTQILLEPWQHSDLTRIARLEGRSMSEIVRAIVGEELLRRRRHDEGESVRRGQALQRVRARREEMRGAGPDVMAVDASGLINELREERDAGSVGESGGGRRRP